MKRKTYECPKLTNYGDFKSLTNAKGGKKGDNVVGKNTKSKV